MKQRQRPRIHTDGVYSRLINNKDSDDSGDEVELATKRKIVEVPTVERVVEDDDTLQAISIRYGCTLSELKRLNNIHRENEIYAKRTIKVPAKALSAILAGVHSSGTNSPPQTTDSLQNHIDTDLLSNKIISLPSTSTITTDELNNVIFNSTLKPPESNDSPIEHELSEETTHFLPPHVETVVTRLSFNGADADIPWIALIICMVILIFAVPLIYVFYIAEHLEQYHHS